jgi:hypothetical protein
VTAGLGDERSSLRNRSVSQSAALAMAAQRTAWQERCEHTAATQSSTSTQESFSKERAPELQAGRTRNGSGSSNRTTNPKGSNGGSSSSGHHLGAGWQLSSTYSEALECWTATGLTARLSAAATEAAASSTPQHTHAIMAGSAAAALSSHVSTRQLFVAPVQRPPSSRSKQQTGARAGTKPTSQHHQQQHPVKLAAASNSGGKGYLVLPASSTGNSRGGLGADMLGAGCVLVVPSKPSDAQRTASRPSVTPHDASTSSASTSASREGKVTSSSTLRSTDGGTSSSSGGTSKQPKTATAVAMTAFAQEPLSTSISGAAGAGAAALVMPDPRQHALLLPFLATVSAAVIGSGLLLGLF